MRLDRQLTLLLVLLLVPASARGTDYESFRRGVQQAVRQGRLLVEEPIVNWTGPRPTVVLPPLQWYDADDDVRMEAVRTQLRVEAIRKYRLRTPQQRKFWGPVLKQVEGEICVLVEQLDRASPDADELARRIQTIDDIYRNELDRLARAEGKEGVSLVGESAAAEINVRFVEGGEVRYMSSGRFTMHQVFEKQDPNWSSTGWTDVLSGQSIVAAQICHFAYRFSGGRVRYVRLVLPDASEARSLVFTAAGASWQAE